MSIFRAAAALPGRLSQWAYGYFSKEYAADTGRIGIATLSAYKQMEDDGTGNFVPKLDQYGNPIYVESATIVTTIPEISGFLNAYDLASALASLGFRDQSVFGAVETSSTTRKPAGAQTEVAVPFQTSTNLPSGMFWGSADPTYVYFDRSISKMIKPYVKIGAFNGTPGQDYARMEIQGRNSNSDPWVNLGGGNAGAGAIRVANSIDFQGRPLVATFDQMRLRIVVGSYSASALDIDVSSIQFRQF